MTLLFLLPAAFAHDPVEADTRPDPAFPSSPPIGIDDAETVEKHHVEINLTSSFSGGHGAWESEALLVDANYGLTDNIHVNAEIPYVVGGEAGAVRSGLGQGAVAMKLRVLHRDRVQLAFHPAIELPSLPASVAYEARQGPSLTIPVVVDFAVGDRGGGVGIQLSRSFTLGGAEDTWGAAVGFATPLNDTSALLFDYNQEASAGLALGEGWFEVGYVHDNLFGSEHLTLLSALGRSTEGNSSAMLGVQVGL